MPLMDRTVLELRALAAARGKRGQLVSIGLETRTQQDLVEQGHLWQSIADGQTYRFTLSPSGQKMLDEHDRNN